MEISTITVPLTLENMPSGNLWEADGACWRCIVVSGKPRWSPQNWKAFDKGEPKGEMTDFIPIVGLSRKTGRRS